MVTTPADLKVIDDLIAREGSTFTDRATDKGGPTKFGITQRTLTEWLKRNASLDDVRNLTEADARQVYETLYVAPFADLSVIPLRSLAIDTGVLFGVGTAIVILQASLNVIPDGILGPITKAALNAPWISTNPKRFMFVVVHHRLMAHFEQVQKDPAQFVNLPGWVTRALSFLS